MIYLAAQIIALLKFRLLKYIGLAAAVLLVIACFMPWVLIESRNITVSGVDAGGTRFGKPGYFHFVLTGIFIVCTLVQRVGVKRLNLLVTALNIGWAIRNYFIISACSGGECPEKKAGLFLVMFTSIVMLLSSLFPDMKLPVNKKQLMV